MYLHYLYRYDFLDKYFLDRDGVYHKIFVYKIPNEVKPKMIDGIFMKSKKEHFEIDLNSAY